MIVERGVRKILNMEKRQMINKCKGNIFDLDGTLLDSMGLWQQIDVKFLTKRGLEVSADYQRRITPMGFFDAAVYTIERFALYETPDELIQEWIDMAY